MVLKRLVLSVATLGGCGGLKGLILDGFYFGRMW